jgi:6-pyruvoyltetrahydropterin/6-carboxytetrahydropterin synthase
VVSKSITAKGRASNGLGRALNKSRDIMVLRPMGEWCVSVWRSGSLMMLYFEALLQGMLMPMFTVLKSVWFSAAHSLREYDGPCARNHGHNYRLEIVVRGRELDGQRMLVDFLDLDRAVAPLVSRVDHRNLNEVPPFDEVNPTAEAIAAWFFRELKAVVPAVSGARAQLAEIRLWETPDACVIVTEEP